MKVSLLNIDPTYFTNTLSLITISITKYFPEAIAFNIQTTIEKHIQKAIAFYIQTTSTKHIPEAIAFNIQTTIVKYIQKVIEFYIQTTIAKYIPKQITFHIQTTIAKSLPKAIAFYIQTTITKHFPKVIAFLIQTTIAGYIPKQLHFKWKRKKIAEEIIERQKNQIDYYKQIVESNYEAQCPITVAGQKKKGDSKIVSLMKESKDDERKEERKASGPFFLSCPGLGTATF